MLAAGVPDQIGQKCGWVVVTQCCAVAEAAPNSGFLTRKNGSLVGE